MCVVQKLDNGFHAVIPIFHVNGWLPQAGEAHRCHKGSTQATISPVKTPSRQTVVECPRLHPPELRVQGLQPLVHCSSLRCERYKNSVLGL